jgi:hypothetical protein
MGDLISVPFSAYFWCQVSVSRCQFADFSFLTPETRNLKPHLLSNVTK